MYLACGGELVRVYKTEDYTLHQKYKAITFPKKKIARDIGWSHNGKYFGIIVDGDPTFEITHFGETMRPFENFQISEPSAIAFPKLSTGSAAIGTKSGVVHTINYLNKKAVITFPSCNTKITAMDYNFNDTSVAAGTIDGKIFVCGIQNRQIVRDFNLPTPQVISAVKFHHSRKGILAVSSHDGHVTVWDTNFNSIESKFSDHAAQCMGVVFSPLNRSFMATVGFDYLVYCYDMRAKRQVLKADIPAAGSSLDVHKNGNILAVSTVSGTICIFDLRNTRAPTNRIITKGRTVKLMYQLEPEDSKKSSSGKASSLERLVHKRNSNEPRTSGSLVTETFVSVSDDSQSSDDSSLLDCFSPITSKTPVKPTKEILSFSSLSASKISDVKILSFTSSKKESPGGHTLSCNNTEEFAAGLMKKTCKSESDLPYSHLDCITETAGEETRFLKSVDDCTVPRTPLVSKLNSPSKDAPKIKDMKNFSISSFNKAALGDHSLSCNSSKEFAAGLLKKVSKTGSDLPHSPLGSISEAVGEETKFLKSMEDCTVPKTPHMAVQNGYSNDGEVPHISKEVVPESPVKVLSDGICKTPKPTGINGHLVHGDAISSPPREGEDDLSEVDTSDLLNKYSMTKELGKECDATISLGSSVDFSVKEKDAVVVQSEEVSPSSPEEEVESGACAAPLVPSEFPSSHKEYLDAKFLEQADTLHSNLSKMHLFNVFALSKHELMLERILKVLEERTVVEKVDKCVGTR